MKKHTILTRGILKENPVLVLVLGTCPSLAITTQAINGVGMGLAATLVLLCSNLTISALRRVIPDAVRIPSYIVLIAGFVTVVQMLVEAYAYSLYQALGIYLPLIVVNCIILGRAEMFASKNTVTDSLLDAVGMGLGFTLALLALATVREILGMGTWFGLPVPFFYENPIAVMTQAPGGFFFYGCLIATVNAVTRGRAIKKKEFGCAGCPGAGGCGHREKEARS